MTHAPARLTDAEVQDALLALPAWRAEGGKLRRTYAFRDFVEAWGFMSSAALIVQQMDHHPEWSNVYNQVHVSLVTHDAHGVTARDVELARRLEALAARWGRP
uniref:Putative pterin-4-alpha-carbinolamine dehydratase n=1 Tax=Eiseniibacteriota bacterium TaxID=2212470 RepID=A0A832MMR3_UNCEI